MYSMVKRLRVLAVVGVAVALVASACGEADEQDKKAACPPKQEPTGVDSPAEVDPDETYSDIALVDSGFTVAKTGGSDHVSYGVLIENASDLVLYDASISVEFRDSNGNDPFKTIMDHPSASDASIQKLKEVPVPVLMPGERIGIGDWFNSWVSELADERTHEMVDVERPKYDDLSIGIELVDGGFWPERNDVYSFVSAPVSSASITGDSNFQSALRGGKQINEYMLSAYVAYEGCEEVWGAGTSSVLYDEDGTIVGGGFSSGIGSLPSGSQKSKTESKAWGPEGDVTAEVFQYAKPLKVNLK